MNKVHPIIFFKYSFLIISFLLFLLYISVNTYRKSVQQDFLYIVYYKEEVRTLKLFKDKQKAIEFAKEKKGVLLIKEKNE